MHDHDATTDAADHGGAAAFWHAQIALAGPIEQDWRLHSLVE